MIVVRQLKNSVLHCKERFKKDNKFPAYKFIQILKLKEKFGKIDYKIANKILRGENMNNLIKNSGKFLLTVFIATSFSYASDENVATLTDIKESLSYLINFHENTKKEIKQFIKELEKIKQKIEKNRKEIEENNKKIATINQNINNLQQKQQEILNRQLNLLQKHYVLEKKVKEIMHLSLQNTHRKKSVNESELDKKILDFVKKEKNAK